MSRKRKRDDDAVTVCESVRFDANGAPEPMLAHLNEHGYAVVGNVATQSEVSHATDLFWQWAAPLGLARDRPDTWDNDDTDDGTWPIARDTGIVGSFGIGQSAFMWNVRSLAAVRRVFAQIWQTDDLLTSFDGCCAFRPWTAADTRWRTDAAWWHVDQNAHTGKTGRQCVQGALLLTDSNGATGGLCVVPASHRSHDAVCERNAVDDCVGDFLPVSAADALFNNDNNNNNGGVMLCARAGDMIVWDSRTVHCSSPALVAPLQLSPSLLRLAAFVCMTPRAMATAAVLRRRRRAQRRDVTTTHWPHEFHPNDDGIDGADVCVLTVAQKRLIG